MKLAALIATLSLAAASAAMAVPVALDLDAASGGVNQADFTVGVDVGGTPVSVGDTLDASGSIAADVGFSGATPTSIQFLDGTDIGFSDVTLFFGPIQVAETMNVRGTITSGALAVSPTGEVDLGGSVLTLDEGFVDVIGDDPANNDLAGNPIVLTLAAGSLATLDAADLGNGSVGLVLSGPIAFSGQVDDDPVITLSVTGNLTARGIAAVPEPGFAIALASAGLLALRRRSRASERR